MRIFTPIILLLFLLLACTGCHLSIDLEAHPYADEAGDDVGPDGADASQPVGPKLLITELMLRPAPLPGGDERLGQYIELFNAGDEPIHPADLILEVLETNERIFVDLDADGDPHAQAAADAVRPIEPGEFFLFIGEDDPHYGITDHLSPGSFYEFRRWGSTVELSATRQTLRLLELRGEFEFRIHHQVGWRQGELTDLSEQSEETVAILENVGLGLQAGITDVGQASTPENWCLHIERFGEGPLYGSPGAPSPDRCF